MCERAKKNIVELTRMGAEECRSGSHLPLRLALDSVRSLNNVGAMLRTSDAFGVECVSLCGITGTPPHAEIHKTALGAEESVNWEHCPDTLAKIRELQAQGWHVCVLEQTHNSVPLGDFEVKAGEKYAIVVGNEVKGVEQSVVDAADSVIEIPQCGAKHSLNVSVSCGIALWHFYSVMKGGEA